MRDDNFTTDSGIVNIHPSKETHWVMYTNQTYFDSYVCPPQQTYSITLTKVSIQNINFRRMIAIAQLIVYMFYILHKV